MKHTLSPWDGGFVIRSWRQEDGEAMADLHCRAIMTSGEIHYSQAQLQCWAHNLTAEVYAESAQNGENYLVAANEDDQPLAFCGYKENEICGLYVDPLHQGRGIGRRLLFRAISNMHQSQPEKTILSASAPAKPFYEKFGYSSVGERIFTTRGGAGINVYDMESNPIPYSDKLGPHEGRELSLMLERKKRLAFFSERNPVEAFAPHMRAGEINCDAFPEYSQDIYEFAKARNVPLFSIDPTSIYYLPGEGGRMEELKASLLQLTEKNTREHFLELHRRVGELLDYSEEAINYYIELRRQRLEEKHG